MQPTECRYVNGKVSRGALMRAAAGSSGCDTDSRRQRRDVTLLPSAGPTQKHTAAVDPYLSDR